VIGRARTQGLDDDIHGAALDAQNAGRYEIREILVNGRPVVAVIVQPRIDEVSQTSDGRVLVRRGGHNRALFGRELFDLMATRSLMRYEATDSRVPVTSTSGDLAQEVARAFGCSDPSAFEQRWRERGFLHESGNLTGAGALVLTDPATSLRAAKFHVDVRSYESSAGTSYVRREIIGGPVQRQVERTTDLVVHDIGTEMVVTGAYRRDVPRLPRRVVREAIANAVAHRSYEFDTSPVVIEVRPGRVLVSSPGRLPAPVTIATLREAQVPRNHTVIDALRRFGLAEDSGQGIDVIQDIMRLELLEEPLFSEDADSFQVELPMRGLVSTTERGWLAEFERTGLVGDQERVLLLTLLRDTKVTNARARDVLAEDSTDARARLHRLRDAGLVVQHGTRGRTYYTVGSIGPARSNEQVVLDAAADGPISNAQVRGLTGLDRVAARSLLRRLVDEGRLVQRGQRRGSSYTIP
jgi:ATP-dependent DNA helicase RecG